MNLNQVDVSKLPADIRKQYKQLQVMHAERKIQNMPKNWTTSWTRKTHKLNLKTKSQYQKTKYHDMKRLAKTFLFGFQIFV